MANPLFGEAMAVAGEGRELTLRFDFDAFCVVEDLADRPIDEVLVEMAGPLNPATKKPLFRHPRMRTQQRMLYAATRFHHPEVTLEECKVLVTTCNTEILWPMLSALGRAMGKASEIDAAIGEGGAADAGENPPLSAPGIGADSSTDGAPPGSTRPASDGKRQAPIQEP
jgi:hypothetical protein